MEIIFLVLLILVVFYVVNKNKKGNPKLLDKRTEIFKDLIVNNSADLVFKEILRFGQNSNYTIDYVDAESHQLILNYVPKMGQQTNGSFFPIWVSDLEDGRSKVCIGAKDKSSISMNFEVKAALNKLVPLLEATLYSMPAPVGDISNHAPQNNKIWTEERDLSNSAYQIFLVKKYSIEKNDVLGIFIADSKSYDSVKDALAAAHEIDVSLPINRKK
jgi:hypothetical protein